MTNQGKRWEVLSGLKTKNKKEIIEALLKNRGIKGVKDKKEFFHPTDPMKISLKSLGIKESEVKKAAGRIKKAKKNKEKVIIYGDYDADGICATAILWETLYALGLNVLPYIPERFSEGYGLNTESIKKLKKEDPNLKLIITVDHGIVADKKVDLAGELGIDVIVTDHHQKGKIIPKALAIIHTDRLSGSGISWILSREISKNIEDKLELAAIGTIADQLPLVGPNRSVVKYGLTKLNKTRRPGLLALFEGARIKNEIGPYEVGFLIAPRINSMGRLEHAIESLRLLCTRDKSKAAGLARHMNSTNSERQRIVEEVVLHAREKLGKDIRDNIIILAHKKYHEGVIGLAAARLVEEFYRPAIVLSKKGDISKASARSISGFNIIEAIRSLEGLYIEGGGHPMAAGFSIETKNIEKFGRKINTYAKKLLTKDILSKKLRIDLEIDFSNLTWDLYKFLRDFEPTGLGNPGPTFSSTGVEILNVRTVGQEARHLKLRLKQGEHIFDAIYFGGGEIYSTLTPDTKIDIVYQLEDNTWNNHKSLQLKIKDLKLQN
jgi:single-stranded-DNA-specific exonuclease